MKFNINHIAIWVNDLEASKLFYENYFSMQCGEKYHNPIKQFTSYFLSFPEAPVRIELMHRPDIPTTPFTKGMVQGMAHIAISVGSKASVNALTEKLRADNYAVISEPRITGDGYYESVVLDLEGNQIEITE